MGTALAKLSKLRTSLEAAKTLDEVVDLRDQAAAIVTYAKAIGERREIVNAAVEGKLRCERKAGAFLATVTGGKGGDRKSSNTKLLDSLEDKGVKKIQSHRWQRLATIPDDEFDAIISSANEESLELTTAAVLRHAATKSKPQNGKPLKQRDGIGGHIERLRLAVVKIYSAWPHDYRPVLADRLRAYADELDKNGELRL